jgi:predicted ATPase/DNA-binding XRE family transcriptional regulator
VRLAELIRQHRARAHLSQEELAERAGVSARTIGDIETGISLWPRAITISLIAEALELDAQARETLRTASSRRGLRQGAGAALPQAVDLIGREREIAALRALLLDPATRLVTLTGGPGVGKTALAVALAADVADAIAGEVRFIEFATLPDPLLVPTKIALALGVRDVRGDSVAASVASVIGDRPMLLVLDNFERMIPAAQSVAELLTATRNLKVLVTSRAALHLSMERQMKLDPLSPTSSAQLLFARIRSGANDGEAPDETNVAELTRALGGVPLAIELAAPLLRGTSSAELAARLQHPLDVLVAMRDAVGYSYALLAPSHQRIFRALSVFDGPFTEEGAQQLAADGEREATTIDTLRTISALIDQSLIGVREDPTGEPEFSIHPLVSEFAAQALERERESDAAYLRLAEYCTALARVPPHPEPFADPAVRTRLSRESSHFDAALGWLRATKRVARALELVIELWPIWFRRGETAHGYAWARSLLDAESAEPIDEGLHAEAHRAATGLAEASGRYDDAERHGSLALAHKRAIGDEAAVASILAGLGVCAHSKGDYSGARGFLEESLTIRRDLGDGLNVARALLDLGTMACDEGKFDEATTHLDEALTLFRAAGRRMGGSLTLGALALVKVRAGAPELAKDLANEAARIAEAIGFMESARAAKLIVSRALVDLGDLQRAQSTALDLIAAEADGPAPDAGVLRVLAAIEFQLGRVRLAARLLGAASTAPALPVIPLADRAAYDALVASVAAALGEEFEARRNEGRERGAAAIVAEA